MMETSCKPVSMHPRTARSANQSVLVRGFLPKGTFIRNLRKNWKFYDAKVVTWILFLLIIIMMMSWCPLKNYENNESTIFNRDQDVSMSHLKNTEFHMLFIDKTSKYDSYCMIHTVWVILDRFGDMYSHDHKNIHSD